MKNRKAIAFIMVLAMVFCYAPPTSFAVEEIEGAPNFVDMPEEGFWSTVALGAAVNNGLLKGIEGSEGIFIKPNDTLTRAQMAAIVNRAFGAVETSVLEGVVDVPNEAWYYSDIGKAVKMGTLRLDNKMRPDDPVTRQEAFTVLARATRASGGNSSDLEKFQDKNSLATWAVDGVAALVKKGYVQGSDGKLTPQEEITRAQFAVIMDNVIKQYIGTPNTIKEVVAQGNVMVNFPGATLKNIIINGDLIIGDGVGDGNVTLDNVRVTGDIIARGGGIDSIIIRGGNVEGRIVISKVDGKIRVFLEGGAEAEVIVIDDGKDDVIIEGNVGTLEVNASDVPIIVKNGSIKEIEIKAGSSNTQIGVEKGASVTNITVKGEGTKISGEGEVKSTKIEGNNTTVNTKNTVIKAEGGVSGVVLNGETQATSEEAYEKKTGQEDSAAGGGGPTSPVVLVSEITLTASATTIITDDGTLQIDYSVSPSAATNKNVTWSVSGAAATVNDSGLLTAVTNGSIEVIATAKDGSGVKDSIVLTITGQLLNYENTDALTTTSVAVTYGATSLEALGLLQSTVPTVGVTGTKGELGTATITWTTIAGYDGTSPGTYEATGSLILPNSWEGSPASVTASVIVLENNMDQSGFELLVMPGSPTIEGIMFTLDITNAALRNGALLNGDYQVTVACDQSYLGTGDEGVINGDHGNLSSFSTSVEFTSGGGTLPIFISTPGNFTLTVTISGITNTELTTLTIVESQADILYEVPVVYLGSTTPAYITVTSIRDASGSLRNLDFAEDDLTIFELGMFFAPSDEIIRDAITKEIDSMIIEISDPSLLISPGAYIITIDMEDGNCWDIEIEVTPAAVGYKPDSLDVDVDFGSIIVDMTIKDGEEVLTWADIADTVDMANSKIILSNSEGDEDPILITFAGLGDRLNAVANTITFEGNTGLGGPKTLDFAIDGLLGNFQAFGHNTVDVDLIASDLSWQITASAIIPYLELELTPGAVEGSMELEVYYQQGLGPNFIQMDPSTVNILGSIQNDYETAYNNKIVVAGIHEKSNLYVYGEIVRPGSDLDNLLTMNMSYNSGTNSFIISASRTPGQVVDGLIAFYFYDDDTGTVGNSIIEIFGEGEDNSVEFAHFPMVDEVSDLGRGTHTVMVSFDSDMKQSSVEEINNYMYSNNGMPDTIQMISYDSNTNEATITIAGDVADGDMITISRENGITENNGYELEETVFIRSESNWDNPDGEPASDPILLYENPEMTSPSSIFELDSIVYVLIDYPEGPSLPDSLIEYHASSSVDAVGITLSAIDQGGSNYYASGFMISSNPSTVDELNNLKAEVGGTITIRHGVDNVTAMVISPGGGVPEASVPDGMDIDVDFGSLVFNITPTSGGTPLSMSAIGLDLEISMLELRDTTQAESSIYDSFGDINNDDYGALDQENNQITLGGEYIDIAKSGIFSTSPRALFTDFYYDEGQIVFITLAGIVDEQPYLITEQAIIPWLGLINQSQSGLSLLYDLENNYGIEVSDVRGQYNQVPIFGLEVNPFIEGDSLAKINNVTRAAIGDVVDDDGRIKAYYIGEQTVAMEGGPSYSLDNIDNVFIDLDPITDKITVSATKTNDASSVSALIHLFVEDSVEGNRSFVSFEVLSEAGSTEVKLQEIGENMMGSVNISSDGAEASWSRIDDAGGYLLNLYKDVDSFPEPIYTSNVAVGQSVEELVTVHIGQTIYDLNAGTGNYSAKVQILGGYRSGETIESGEAVYITQMEDVTGVYVEDGVLFWDGLSQNTQGIEIQISKGGIIYTTIASTNNGDSGFDLMNPEALDQGAGIYEIAVLAAGYRYTVIPSQNSTTVEVSENGASPEGKAEDAFIGLDNEQPYFADSNGGAGGYTSGDAIKLNFNEAIDFVSLDLADFTLSGASHWDTTNISEITFNDDNPTLFDKYNDSIVISLKGDALIASGSTITLAEGATTDVLGNTNGSIVFKVEEPYQESPPGTCTVNDYGEFVTALSNSEMLTIGLLQDITDESITITRPVTLELNGYTLGGDVFVTTSAVGQVKFTSPGIIGGDLTIDAPNGTITNEVTVSGSAIINDVSYDSYIAYYPHLGGIIMNGEGRVNLQSGASESLVEVNTSNMVILDGQINQVSIITPNALARVQGSINQMVVNGDAGQVTIELLGGSDVSGINASGSAHVYRAEGAELPSLTGQVTINDGYMVTFDKNGGDTEAKPTYLLWDNSEATSNRMPYEPRREGYSFGGWNTMLNGSGDLVDTSSTVSAATRVYANWLASNIEITGYDPLSSIDGGDIGDANYENAAAVIAYLQANVTCVAISGYSEVVPVDDWVDTDSYVSNVAASYTFTALVGAIPDGFEDLISPTLYVTVEIIVSEVAPPQITLVYAEEGRPNEGPFEEGIGEGDTLAISFDKATNQSGTRTMAQVDEMISFEYHQPALSLGTSYSGVWLAGGDKFVIDIHDGTGGNLTTGYSLTINSAANIRSENGLSAPTRDSGEVVGSFSPEGLYGRVTDYSFNPIGGVEIYEGEKAYGAAPLAITNIGGWYDEININNGTYLKYYHDFYHHSGSPIQVADTGPQNIKMNLAGKITGTVILEGSIPLGTFIEAQISEHNNIEASFVNAGEFSQRGVPLGNKTLSFYLKVPMGVGVPDGAKVYISPSAGDHTLNPGVTFNLGDEAGSPVTNSTLSVTVTHPEGEDDGIINIGIVKLIYSE